MRPATGHTSSARATRRVLLAVTSAAIAAGVMAGTASMATASITKPAASPGNPLSGVPPFFAGIVSQSSGPPAHVTFRDVVKIFRSAKGTPAGTIRAPGSQDFRAVSRLGNDQSFVASAFNRKACVSHLLKFTIDRAGRPSALTPLSAPVSGEVEELTASADGTALAFRDSGCNPGGPQAGVIHLATGRTTRWDTPANAFAGGLSLTADGSVLGFILDPDFNDPNATDQAWTMPTDAPAGPLLKGAHQVPGLGANADQAVLSPSGDQLWIEAQKTPNSKDPVTLSLVTTRTGALVRQVTQLSPGGQDLTFVGLALDNSGQHMLAYGGNPGPGHADAEEIDLSSGQTRTLPITNPVIDGGLTTFGW
ncbi:MAG TPA: hypothetical protein VF204_15110 [Streptosporangiaceae bacterium]